MKRMFHSFIAASVIALSVYWGGEPIAHGEGQAKLRFEPVAATPEQLYVLADLHLPLGDHRPYFVTVEQRYEVLRRGKATQWEPWELLVSHHYVNEGPGDRRLATIDLTSKNKSLSKRGDLPEQLEVRLSLYEDSTRTKKVREAVARLPVPQP